MRILFTLSPTNIKNRNVSYLKLFYILFFLASLLSADVGDVYDDVSVRSSR